MNYAAILMGFVPFILSVLLVLLVHWLF